MGPKHTPNRLYWPRSVISDMIQMIELMSFYSVGSRILNVAPGASFTNSIDPPEVSFFIRLLLANYEFAVSEYESNLS